MGDEGPGFEDYVNMNDVGQENRIPLSPPAGSAMPVRSHRASRIDEPLPFQSEYPQSDGVRMRPNASDDNEEEYYEICYDYKARQGDELDLKRGSVVRVVKGAEQGWVHGVLEGKAGVIPTNYLKQIGSGNFKKIRPSDLEILSLIGEGAAGYVHHAKLGIKMVAFKKFKLLGREGDGQVTERAIEAVKHEAVYYSSLRHQNIVGLIGVCLEHPIGIALELCQGGSLTQVFRRVATAAIPKRILVRWAIQIASAMECISTKFVHRDLKMDNVLVLQKVCFCHLSTSRETPDRPNLQLYNHEDLQANGICKNCDGMAFDRLLLKLTDFGLTRENSRSDRFSTAAGTSPYIAPEAYTQNLYSEFSDVWSFGVVLWELITRKKPYEGHDERILPFLVAKQTVQLPITKEFPSAVADIITRCFDRVPEKRPRFTVIRRTLEAYQKELESLNNPADTAEMQDIEKEIRRQYKEANEKVNDPSLARQIAQIVREFENQRNVEPFTTYRDHGPEPAKRAFKGLLSKDLISSPSEPRHMNSLGPSGGTLPRRLNLNIDTEASSAPFFDHGHTALKATLSKSQPNLNQICSSPGPSTITREKHHGIRKKKDKTPMEIEGYLIDSKPSPTSDPIEVAPPFSESFTEGFASSNEKRPSDGSVLSRVEGPVKEKKDRASRLFGKVVGIFSKGGRHSRPSSVSVESDDYNPDLESIGGTLPRSSATGSRSHSVSASSALCAVNATRTPVALAFLSPDNHHRSGRSPEGRNDPVNGQGNEYSSTPKDDRRKGFIQSTDQTRTYTRGAATNPGYSALSTHRPTGLSGQQPLHLPSHAAPSLPTPSSSSSASATPCSGIGIDDQFPAPSNIGSHMAPYVVLQDTSRSDHTSSGKPKLPPRKNRSSDSKGLSTDSRTELSTEIPVHQSSPSAFSAGSVAQRRSRTVSSSAMDSPTSEPNAMTDSPYIQLPPGPPSSSSPSSFGGSSQGVHSSSSAGVLGYRGRRDSSPEYIVNPSYEPYRKMQNPNADKNASSAASLPPAPVIPPRGNYVSLSK